MYVDGCSITAGQGFVNGKDDDRTYAQQISKLYGYTLTNNAEGGSSNHKIFLRASQALVEGFHDLYIVQWTALHRHWVYPAPNLGIYIGADGNLNYDAETNKFIQHYQLLNHDYVNILHLIQYSRVLEELAKCKNKQIIFVNGLVLWTDDMLNTTLPTSEYHTQLYCNLSLTEEQRFRQQLKNNLELVDFTLWINPWNSIMSMQVDNADLDIHPGAKTHEIVVQLLKTKIHD